MYMLFGFTQYEMCSGVPVVELEISWEFLAKKLDFISARNFRVLFLCLCLNLETKQFEKQNPSWHTPMNTLSNFVMAKFPFKGREGGIVLKILTKIVPPQRCFPPFFVSLSLSLKGRRGEDWAPFASEENASFHFLCCAFNFCFSISDMSLQWFLFFLRKPNEERVSRSCVYDAHVYICILPCIYIYSPGFTKCLSVFVCVPLWSRK